MMRCVEMIRVRSTTEEIADLYNGLSQVISDLRKITDIRDAILLIHALYVGDLAVILIWKELEPPKKTPEGIVLANTFEEYGTVEHSVWMIASEDLCRSHLSKSELNSEE